MSRPRLALTPGEPAGIGPDLVARLAHEDLGAELVVVGDPDLLVARARRLGLGLSWREFVPGTGRAPAPRVLQVLPVRLSRPVEPGRLDPANAAYVLETLAVACDVCRDGTCDALVTAPVHKGVINDAGLPFTGHTEFLAERCGGTPVMMLIAPGLRVALATTHLPLRAVSDALTHERLEQVLGVLHRELRARFGIVSPRILVCGLNPHAGEGGHLGREEIEVIGPTLEALRGRGWDLEGPVPADTAFLPERIARSDAVLAMYHDQGLPVLKHLGFGRAVNVTLGLPIIRTSVDHGTALDLAGTDGADPGSLLSAVETALRMVEAAHRSVSAPPGRPPVP